MSDQADWHNRVRQQAARMRHYHDAGRREGYATKAELNAILTRQGGTCAYCSTSADLTLDHKLPRCWGGTSWPSNLQFLCRLHNRDKGREMDATYRARNGLPAPDIENAEETYAELMGEFMPFVRDRQSRSAIGMANGRKANADKQAAIAEGRRFYHGEPCKRGHNGERYVSTNACRQCIADSNARSNAQREKGTKAEKDAAKAARIKSTFD